MKRSLKIIHILFFVNVLFCLKSFSQEAFYYANLDRDFYEGKDLFVQKKYQAATRCFEKFLKNREKQTDKEFVQFAKFYIATAAYEMRKENAILLLENYLTQYPYTQYYDRTCLMIGNLAFERKQYNKAIEYYENAKEKRLSKKERSELVFNKGYAYMQKKEMSKAKKNFKILKGSKSKYRNSAQYYYSYIDYQAGNYDSALEGFLQIENVPEFKAFVPFYIVQIYYHNKNYDSLIPYAEKILSEEKEVKRPSEQYKKNIAEVYRILGECAYQKEDYQKTITSLNQYEKRTKKVVREDMYILGISYFKTKDFKNAIARLSKVTNTKDSLAQNAYLHLGHCYVDINQKANARMAYQNASKMDFDSSVKEEAAYNYTMSTLETTTPFGESIVAFEDFQNNFPNSKFRKQIYERLVTVYMTSKNYEAANESLSKLNELSPEMKDVKAYILYQLGTEEFVKENYAKAISLFDQAIATGSSTFNVGQVFYWRAESKYRMGAYSDARVDYISFFEKKGATEFENYNMANYGIAYTFFQEKKYKEAIPFFQKYEVQEQNKKKETYTDALDRLGDCFFVLRDLINAEKYYTLSFGIGGRQGDYPAFQRAYVQGLRKNYIGKINGLSKLMTNYPKSDYIDDAYYEMARAYILTEQDAKAIETYKTLMQKFPMSPLSRKASLELGMLYYNAEDYDKAIVAYKSVVANYPNSEETRTALAMLETIYIDKNEVDQYFAYTRDLGSNIVLTDPTKEDSLTYLAAERIYMKGETATATMAFEKYIHNFCDTEVGRFCLPAKYYLADCYYNADKKDEAFELYRALAKMEGNSYMEVVLVRLSEIAYDKTDYNTALEAFKKLQIIAQEPDNMTAAKIGVLRCSFLLNDANGTIASATNILSGKTISSELENEARYYLAKAYLQIGENEKAQKDLLLLSKDTRTANGAEAKYLVANHLFEIKKDKESENEIMNFIEKGTPHQYWLARAFVLLADIYIYRKDDFQAKQYLLSLQENYKQKDSIQDLIQERLDQIQERENAVIEEKQEQIPVEEEEQIINQ